MTNNQFNSLCKETVICALKGEYGFAPKKSEITLLEAHKDRTYILFSINGNEYEFSSSHQYGEDGTGWGVWCGKGTITKKDE